MEADTLEALSRRTTALVAERAAHVVRVEGRRRGAASGVVWSADGLVVTPTTRSSATRRWRSGCPPARPRRAEVVGRDPTTDLALLRVRGDRARAGRLGGRGAAPRASSSLAVSRPGRSPRAALGVVARAAGEYRAARRRPRSTASSRPRSSSTRASPAALAAVRVGRAARASRPPGSCAARR